MRGSVRGDRRKPAPYRDTEFKKNPFSGIKSLILEGFAKGSIDLNLNRDYFHTPSSDLKTSRELVMFFVRQANWRSAAG